MKQYWAERYFDPQEMDVDPDTVNLTPAIGNEHGKWEDTTHLY
jgi:hypothetical protein